MLNGKNLKSDIKCKGNTYEYFESFLHFLFTSNNNLLSNDSFLLPKTLLAYEPNIFRNYKKKLTTLEKSSVI